MQAIVKSLLALILLVAAPALPAAAAAQGIAPQKWNPKAPENRKLIRTFSYATVEPVLKDIGARYQRRKGPEGAPALMVEFPNKRRAVLLFHACQGRNGCNALSMQSFWTRIANSPPDEVDAAIEAFNRRYSYSKAYISKDGRPAMQRYLVADYGIVRGSLAVDLLVFANQADLFARTVLKPLESPGG
ncbi:MAG: YbjN domain-containing protein [Sphingomonadaceae bacterium]